jgi:hypothetical protein
MNLPTDKILAVLPMADPSPVAFMNLYEPGDVWVKVQGCDACTVERSRACCGAKPGGQFHCPHVMVEGGCSLHAEHNSSKPMYCAIQPTPEKTKGHCALVYRCVSGKWISHERHLCDRRGVLRLNGEAVGTE